MLNNKQSFLRYGEMSGPKCLFLAIVPFLLDLVSDGISSELGLSKDFLLT
jgi:hypothetical protein